MADEKFITTVEQRLTAVDETGPAFQSVQERQQKQIESEKALNDFAERRQKILERQAALEAELAKQAEEASKKKIEYATKEEEATGKKQESQKKESSMMEAMLEQMGHFALGYHGMHLVIRNLEATYEEFIKTLEKAEKQLIAVNERIQDNYEKIERKAALDSVVSGIEKVQIDSMAERVRQLGALAAAEATLESAINRRKSAELETGVTSGAMTPGQATAEKQRMVEQEAIEKHNREVSALESQTKEAEDRLNKLKSVQLTPEQQALEKAKKELEDAKIAGVAPEQLLKDAEKAAGEAKEKVLNYSPLTHAKQVALGMATGGQIWNVDTAESLQEEEKQANQRVEALKKLTLSKEEQTKALELEVKQREANAKAIETEIKKTEELIEKNKERLGLLGGPLKQAIGEGISAGRSATRARLESTFNRAADSGSPDAQQAFNDLLEYENSLQPSGGPRADAGGSPSWRRQVNRATTFERQAASLDARADRFAQQGNDSAAMALREQAQAARATAEAARQLSLASEDIRLAAENLGKNSGKRANPQ